MGHQCPVGVKGLELEVKSIDFVLSSPKSILIIHKPITYITKIFIYPISNFINIFMLTNKTRVINTEKEITFGSL